ncbi:MAG: hypothetical protein WAM27_10720 [Nitrososphaeraceae archaeon]
MSRKLKAILLISGMVIGAWVVFIAVMTMIANSQLQTTDNRSFFMSLKLGNPQEITPGSFFFDVLNMTTNMNNFNQNGTIEYDLDDADVSIDDSSIQWSQSFKIIDTSESNIIKTRNGNIGLNAFTENYEKQYNTLTNTTSYTGISIVYLDSGGYQERVADVSLKAVILPNGTGTLEIRSGK